MAKKTSDVFFFFFEVEPSSSSFVLLRFFFSSLSFFARSSYAEISSGQSRFSSGSHVFSVLNPTKFQSAIVIQVNTPQKSRPLLFFSISAKVH